jgi:hypothetical protein
MRTVSILLVLVFLISGCGYRNTPVGAASKYFDAMSESDFPLLIESLSDQDRASNVRSYDMLVMKGNVDLSVGWFSVSNLWNYNISLSGKPVVIWQGRDTAIVQGEGYVTLPLFHGRYCEQVVTIRENGEWRVSLSHPLVVRIRTQYVNNLSAKIADAATAPVPEQAHPLPMLAEFTALFNGLGVGLGNVGDMCVDLKDLTEDLHGWS